jgi:hypothetical protein
MIKEITLQEIWKETNTIAGFIKRADHNGFGLWSIRNLLWKNEFELTEDEINELRM